jgi:molybdenum cofactor cytidylyltransferase
MISAIILAAGLSVRMGHLKQLLPYGEHTIVEQVVSVLLAAPVDEVLVVTGYRRAAVEAVLRKWPIRTVYNPCYAEGEMLSSVQAGLRALSDESRTALLMPGDMPGIEHEVVARLVDAYSAAGDDGMAFPSYRMRAGHPVLVPRSYWSAILSLPSGDNLRSVLRAESALIHWVAVHNPSVLRDVDTPEDYRRELGMRESRSGESGNRD